MNGKAPYAQCEKCPLRNRPVVPGYGPPPEEARCVLVGEAPGRTEAINGFPFIGQSGQLMRAMLRHVGINGGAGLVVGPEGYRTCDNGEVYYTNACICQPAGNQIPPGAAKFCRERLAHELKPYWDAHTPIAALGVTAGHVVIGESEKSLRGNWYRQGRVLASWHPAYVLRVPDRLSELMMDLRRLARGSPMELPTPQREIPSTPGELDEVIDRVIALNPPAVCFDLETDQLMWWRHDILCAAFAWDLEHAFVIPNELIYEETTARSLDRFFGSGIPFVGHNIKFDLRFMVAQMGISVIPYLEDTLIAHHALDENMRHALKPLLRDFFDIGDYEGRLIHRFLRTKGDFYSKVPMQYLYEYNVLDVCYTLRLWYELKRQLDEDDLYDHPYQYPMMASQPMLIDLELEGIPVNVDQLRWLEIELTKGIEQVQSELEEDCGRKFNVGSWKQVSDIMYEHYGLPYVTGRGFKRGSTCLQARRLILLKVSPNHPGAKWLLKLQELKSMTKLRSSYVVNVWKYLDDYGKVHPDGLIYGTESGRMSFRDPAIQTIPRPGTGSAVGDVWGQHVRGYYHAPEGYKMVEVDISQAEMRVACALSGEPFLHKIYREGRDLHTEVALEMYGPDYTADQRNACKKFNFAFLYGGTEHSFALEEGMDIAVARRFVRDYQRVMPVLTAWKASMLEELKSTGYVATRTGRRRRFPLITNDNLDDARKAAVNTPVQGMASDITLMTAIEVWKWLVASGLWQPRDKINTPQKAALVGIIHDSVLLIVQDAYVKEVAIEVMRIMESVGDTWVPEVPWRIDSDVGQDWGHLKDISEWPEFALSATKS